MNSSPVGVGLFSTSGLLVGSPYFTTAPSFRSASLPFSTFLLTWMFLECLIVHHKTSLLFMGTPDKLQHALKKGLAEGDSQMLTTQDPVNHLSPGGQSGKI